MTALQLICFNVAQHDPDSTALLGYWYMIGYIVPQDTCQGFELIQKAKTLGCHHYDAHLLNMSF